MVNVPSSVGIDATSILARLRNATRPEHEEIEAQLNLPSWLTSTQSYRYLLDRFFGFFEPVEAALCDIPMLHVIIPDLAARMRTGLLQRDLVVLGASRDTVDRLPRCSKLPRLYSTAEAVGCLYVLEGSTLGGQFIARQVRASGPSLSQACHFFNSHGDNVGSMWKRFCLAVEQYGLKHPAEAHEICTAAKQTFNSLQVWMLGPPTADHSSIYV